jgi:hypothetical protein
MIAVIPAEIQMKHLPNRSLQRAHTSAYSANANCVEVSKGGGGGRLNGTVISPDTSLPLYKTIPPSGIRHWLMNYLID